MKTILVIIITMTLICGAAIPPAAAAKKAASSADEEVAAALVAGVRALDPAILDVRPANVQELAQPIFKVRWMPAVTLRKDTPVKKQEEIAKKLARFVVDFQGGVPVEGSFGGVLAFVEGEAGWTPQIGQVAYRITSHAPLTIEVFPATNIVDESGNVSCCDDGKPFGKIVNNRFE